MEGTRLQPCPPGGGHREPWGTAGSLRAGGRAGPGEGSTWSWDVGCGMCPGWIPTPGNAVLVPGSELAASPAWGAHGGTAGVGPPGAAELEPPGKVESWNILPFGVKAGAWRTGSQAAALGCIPEGGKYLTFPAEAAWPGPGCPEILSLCCGVGACGVSLRGLGGERGVPAAGLGLLRWVRV